MELILRRTYNDHPREEKGTEMVRGNLADKYPLQIELLGTLEAEIRAAEAKFADERDHYRLDERLDEDSKLRLTDESYVKMRRSTEDLRRACDGIVQAIARVEAFEPPRFVLPAANAEKARATQEG